MHQQLSTGRRLIEIVLAIGLLAALALTTAVTGASPASAAPSAPSGLTPASGTVNADPVFTWSAIRGATGYDIQLASDSAFNAPILTQSMVNHQFTPQTQLPMQKIYWRVRDTVNGVTSRWSSTVSFTRSKLAGPVLLSPATGAELDPPSQAPLLQWAPVNGATKYHVYVDDSSDFLGANPIDVQTTALVYPVAQDAGIYYWKVVAEVGDGSLTTASATRSYVVGSLGDITGASPDVSSTGVEPEVEQVVLSWDPLPGAVSYDLRVSTDINFPDNAIIDQRNVLGTTYSPPKTYDVDEYYWQVRPRNTFGKPKDWALVPKHRFSRTYFDTDNAVTGTATAVPVLEHPVSSFSPPVNDDFYYQWSPVRLASLYWLQLSNDPNFSPTRIVNCYTTQTTFVPDVNSQGTYRGNCAPTVGAAYYWRVKALDYPDKAVESRWSEIHKFVYSPDRIAQISPADGATVTVPALSWDLSTQAVSYAVVVYNANGDQVASANTYSDAWTPPNTLDPAKGPYSWSVQAVDADGRGTPLPANGGLPSFNLAAAPTPTASTPVPTAPSPTASATNRFPSLAWTPVVGATRYQVWVGPSGSGFFTPTDNLWTYPSMTDTGINYLAEGSYDWYVKALDDNNHVVGIGPVSTFAIAPLGVVGNQRVALQGSGFEAGGHPCTRSLAADLSNVCSNLTETPTLDWDSVPGAGIYIVYLSRDAHFQNVIRTDYTTQSRWTSSTTLPDSQAGSAYYWFVRPCKTIDVCAPSPTLATNAFDKLSEPVKNVTVDAADGNDVTFSWQDYLATNQAASDPLTQEHPGQAAQAYRVQVSTTENFGSLIDNVVVDQRTYTAFDKLYPDGPLFVRVQAIDGSNNANPWSTDPATGKPVTFTKTSPQPSVITPQVTSNPASSILTQTEPFKWTAADFAARYEVQVYKNNDTTASPNNLVTLPNGNIGQTSGTIDRPLATGMTYVWRVRRYDASNNPGSWSDWGRFRVTGKAPVQTAPASKALVSSVSSLFKWSVVPGATDYRFERRVANTSNDIDDFDTVSTAWAFPNPMQTGAYEWRVSSRDTVGQVIASSPWRAFHVDATAPTIIKTGPQSPIKQSANLTIRFSETIRGASTSTIKLFKDGTKQSVPIKVTTRGPLVIINPKSNLKKATTYDVVIKAGIKDTSGLPFQPTAYTVGTK